MKKYIVMYSLIGLILVAWLGSAFYLRHEYRVIYDEAVELLDAGKYDEAVERFNDIPRYWEYRDVSELLELEEICPSCGQVIKEVKEL